MSDMIDLKIELSYRRLNIRAKTVRDVAESMGYTVRDLLDDGRLFYAVTKTITRDGDVATISSKEKRGQMKKRYR
jgi:hypothetical protein